MRCCAMLQTWLVTVLRSAKQGVMNQLLQQNNTTAFRTRQSTTFLKKNFLGRFISHLGYTPWPPCSPDLTVPDIFLLG